jgi:hypothetical protein
LFNFATKSKTTTAARPVPRKLNFYIMTKEKFYFAFEEAFFMLFGFVISVLMSLLGLTGVADAQTADGRLIGWTFFGAFALLAVCAAIEYVNDFREGLRGYDIERQMEEARTRYYASRAPRRVLAVSAVAAVAAANPEGFTVNAYTGETPAEGYAVALAETQDSHDAEGLARVLELIQSGTTRAAYVGGWLDRETGRYYYDATVLVQDRAEALALGRANKQIAIFDLANLEEIRL